MKQHIETITQLLLGAAYADKRLAGAEVERIRTILQQVLDTDALPDAVTAQIGRFSPAAFHAQAAAAGLDDLSDADKRKLLELIASINDADDELDLAEDAYLRKVAAGLGVPEEAFADLAIEVLDDDELRGLLA